jgi:hypothetical protein
MCWCNWLNTDCLLEHPDPCGFASGASAPGLAQLLEIDYFSDDSAASTRGSVASFQIILTASLPDAAFAGSVAFDGRRSQVHSVVKSTGDAEIMRVSAVLVAEEGSFTRANAKSRCDIYFLS